MATDYNEQLENSIASECKLTLASGRVANFAYNDTAYACDNVAGTANYNFSQDQNVPLGEAGVLNTTSDILAKGVRSQASSLTRMMLNHFFGRTSYNVNKLADHLLSLFRTVKNFIKENDTTWSATTEYDVGDLVYFVTTLNGKKYKRTFFCIQSCLNIPPIDSNTESVINTSYWSEISGNVVSLSASESIRAKQGIIEQDLVVHGNLFVDGNTTTTTETQVATTGDYLVTRENNPSPMSSGEFSGLAVNNYDTGKMATLTADHCGEWRVSDSATVSAVTYTDISTYEGTFYDGLTRTALASYPSHVLVNVSMLEMLDVVYYNGGYYKKEGNSWYGTVTYSNGALNKGSLITDSEIITALEALTPSSLIYYITVTDNIIDSSSNQPLLTRAESACFNNGDLLMWDSENRTAVKVPSPTCDNQKLTARIDSVTGCLSYAWTDASAVDNATCFAGCTYACAMADFRNYTPSYATSAGSAGSATCFAGCTYACAMADFRNYTPSYATSAGSATYATNAGSATYATNAGSATCFAGCTYACACTDIRSGLVSIADVIDCDAFIPVALCTSASTVGRSTQRALSFNPHTGNLYSAIFYGTSVCVSSVHANGSSNAFQSKANTVFGNDIYVTRLFYAVDTKTLGAVIAWGDGNLACDLFKAIHCNFNLQYQGLTLSTNNTTYTAIMGSFYNIDTGAIKWDRCETPLNYDILNSNGNLIRSVNQNDSSVICGGHLFIVAHNVV